MLFVRNTGVLLLSVGAGLVLTGYGVHSQNKPAPKPESPGSLSGTITDEKKQPVSNAFALIRSGVVITAEEQQNSTIRNPDASGRSILGGGEAAGHRVQSDANAGGLYTLDKLRRGVYNLMVEAGSGSDNKKYRPQRLMSVVVHSGKETTLDITLHEGTTLEEVGEPAVSNPVAKERGWLEGTLTSAEGLPVTSAQSLVRDGITITVKKGSEAVGNVKTDVMAGGFFSVQNCYPGTYSLVIPAGQLPGKNYRPMLLSNVVVKPGQRTLLNIVMPEGAGLERVSAPPVKMQPLKLLTE